MDFKPNKTPVEIIKEVSFGTYFRDIYSGVNGKFYENSWNSYKEYYASDYYDVSLKNIMLNVAHH